MTAAYRMRGLGWFLAVVVMVLGFYLVSLQVAAERKRVEDVTARIAATQRAIRGLETEFNTRANLAQLERWNGEVLALAAPTAGQFLPDEAQLAQINFRTGEAAGVPHNALYVVPSLPVDADRAAVRAPTPTPNGPGTPAPAPAPARAPSGGIGLAANIRPAVPAPIRAQPIRAQPIRPVTIAAAAQTPIVPRQKARSVAMLDRKLANDSTLSDLLSRAQITTESAR